MIRPAGGGSPVSTLAEDICIETASGLEPLIREGRDVVGGLEVTQVFSTAADNQEGVTVTLLAVNPAGEQPPRHLGQLTITGVMAARRGMPRIQLRINLTAAGHLAVRATDVETG